MPRVYADNAGTSCPKPPAVLEAMVRFANECGVAAGRGSFEEARLCHRIIATCRQRLAQLLHAREGDWVVFGLNCTDALNTAIRGLLTTAPRGAHAVATAMEHNSVLRPYHTLAERTGLEFTIVACDPKTGLVDPVDMRKAIRPQTRLVACAHASNVTGTVQPIADVVAAAKERNVPCLIDASQSAGHVPIDVQALGVDFVAFPGHKGLLGPLGTGALYIRGGMEKELVSFREGGTGTQSEIMTQPENMPDKLETGSPNAIGIAGLSEGIQWLLEQGVATLREHDRRLADLFLDLAGGIRRLRVYGPGKGESRVAVFCVNIEGLKPLELAEKLERDFGVLTRAGLHCAPLAHKTVGTFPLGACRLSFGPFNTEEDVRHAAAALADIADNAGRTAPPASAPGAAMPS